MADNMMRVAGRSPDNKAKAFSVEVDNDDRAILRVIKAAEVAYDPSYLPSVDVFRQSQQAKMTVETILNAQTAAPNASLIYDFKANGADEIYFIIAINKAPFTVSASVPWLDSASTFPSTLYPMRNNWPTSHVASPLKSMLCLLPEAGSTTEHASFDLAYKQRASFDGRFKIQNLHQVDTATITIKMLRIWRG